MEWIGTTIGISVLTVGLYFWLTSTFGYWTLRGVPGPAPIPIFGNLFDVAFGKLSVGEYVKIHYDAHRDEKIFGMFLKSKPALVLIDPDLIQDVLIKNFPTFPNRGMRMIFDEYEPLTHHLFNIETPRWRPLRNRILPIFTLRK